MVVGVPPVFSFLLLLVEVGVAPLSHLVPMIVSRGALPRGGLGCAFRQRSFPHRVACDTYTGAWVGFARLLGPIITRECVSLAAGHLCPHTFGYINRALLPLIFWFTAPDSIVGTDRGSEYSMVGLWVPS